MRDPARINRILALLRTLWHRHPDQRLGQLFMNVTGVDGFLVFNAEDDDLEDALASEIRGGAIFGPSSAPQAPPARKGDV